MLEVELTKEFEYEAMESGGRDTNGVLAATDKADAVKQLRDMGLFPTKVREIKHPEKYDSYLEYLSELLGDKFIEWGKKLKRDNNV